MAILNGQEIIFAAVKGDKGEAGVPESGQIGRVLKKINGAEAEWVEGSDIVYAQSSNLYDASKQTPETISPHYYVDGVPYSTNQFDSAYNCTAPIEIAANTTYTIALVPAMFGTVEKPWNKASYGVHFYTKDNEYISGTTENTFKTPANASYLRFNYAMAEGVLLDRMNACCMLVAGDTPPTTYEAYRKQTLKEKFEAIGLATPPIHYTAEGNAIYVVSKYSKTQDVVFHLACKGGNGLFDFWKVGLIESIDSQVSSSHVANSYIIKNSGDWHAPFVVRAKANANGDNPSSGYFTGGNHQYNNSESGSTATARCVNLRFFADNREVKDTSGYANTLKIEWTNYVQANNTTKEDGSGREVLQENHRLVFDGRVWESVVELIPLEDVTMKNWYGFQFSGLNESYDRVFYPSGTNRGIYPTTEYSECGDDKCFQMVAIGSKHRLTMELDPLYDLGKRQFASGITKGAFATTYGKGYFCVVDGTYDFSAGGHYYLRGKYIFESV